MKKYTIAGSIIALIFCVLGGTQAYGAQTEQSQQNQSIQNVAPIEGSVEEYEMEVVADMNIIDSHILKQDNHNLDIEFTLQNGVGVQPDIRYAVQLIENIGNDTYIPIYQKNYNEKIIINEQESIYRKISLNIPSYISGDYDAWIIAENTEGLPLGSAFLDTIKLDSGNNQHISINQKTCKLLVSSDSTEYALVQGVDIAENEQLVLSCEVTSTFKNSISADVNIDTFKRTLFGDRIKINDKEDIKITIEPQETKVIKIAIPHPLKAQSYAFTAMFTNNGNEISDSIFGRYVIQGENASISNIQLDKASYKENDKIKLSFLWTLSADNFDDSRGNGTSVNGAYYDLDIYAGENNMKCIKSIKKEFGKDTSGFEKIIVDSLRECKNPRVQLSMKDKNGNILVQKSTDFVIEDGSTAISTTATTIKKNKITLKNIATGFIIIIVLIALAIIIINKKRGVLVFIFGLSLAGTITVATHDAQALTVTARLGSKYAVCNFGLNRTTVSPGASLTGTASGCKIVSCWNEMRANAYINGSWVKGRSVRDGYGHHRTFTYWFNRGSGRQGITAGSSCRQYNVPVHVTFTKENSSGWHTSTGRGNLYYTVVGCRPPCGPADKGTYEATPEVIAAGRCNATDTVSNWVYNAGLASNGGIAWTWNCNDGSVDSRQCLAYKSGECQDDPQDPPYNTRAEACKFGALNSIRLIQQIDTADGVLKDTLVWRCGTGDKAKTVGNFFSPAWNTGAPVPVDYYGPKAGGVECKCIPTYEYECSSVPNKYIGSCNNNCGGTIEQETQVLKRDTHCFLNESTFASKTEYTTATGKYCPNKVVQCRACGSQNAEGGNYHETN